MWIKPRRFNTIHYGSLTHWAQQVRASPDGGWADFEVLKYQGKNLRPTYLLASEWKYATERLPAQVRSAQPPLKNSKQREKWLYKHVEAIVQSLTGKGKSRTSSQQQLVPASPAPVSASAAQGDDDDWDSSDDDDDDDASLSAAPDTPSAGLSVANSRADTPAPQDATDSSVPPSPSSAAPPMRRECSGASMAASTGAAGDDAPGTASLDPEEAPAEVRQRSRSSSSPPIPPSMDSLTLSPSTTPAPAPPPAAAEPDSAKTTPKLPRQKRMLTHSGGSMQNISGTRSPTGKGSLPPSPVPPRAATSAKSSTPSTPTGAAGSSDDDAKPPMLGALSRQHGCMLMSNSASSLKDNDQQQQQKQGDKFCSPPSASTGSVTDTASGLIHRIAKRTKSGTQPQPGKEKEKPMSQHCAAVLAATERYYGKVEPSTTETSQQQQQQQQQQQPPRLGRARSNSTGTLTAASAGALSRKRAAAAAAAPATTKETALVKQGDAPLMKKGVDATKQGAAVFASFVLQVYARLKKMPLFNAHVEPWIEAFREECPTSEQRTRKRMVLACVAITALLVIVNISNGFFFGIELLVMNAAVVQAIRNKVALVKYFAKAKLSHSTERNRKRFLRTWKKARKRKDAATPPITPTAALPPGAKGQQQQQEDTSSESSDEEILEVLLSDPEN